MRLTSLGGGGRGRYQPEDGERGAILIQVAVAMMVLCGFCGLVIDYGVWSVARAQAQNAADAGALAGATALAFDDVLDTTLAQQNAIRTAKTGLVWGLEPVVTDADIDFKDTGECLVLPDIPPAPARIAACVTVKVYRDEDHSKALPTYFSQLFGITTQNVRAQATASVVPANVARCLWPLAIPDRWILSSAPALPGTFSKYRYPGPPMLLDPAVADSYVAPNYAGDAPGYALQTDTLTDILGTLGDPPGNQLALEGLLTGPAIPTPANPWPAVDKTHFVAVDLPGGFAANLTACNQATYHIGDTLDVDTTATWAQATDGASARKGRDNSADWNGTSFRIGGSCAADNPPCDIISPRLVLVAVFDPEEYDRTRGGSDGHTPTITIVNFVGFFIGRSTDGTTIEGHLTTYPGTVDPDRPFVGYLQSFLRTAVLTR